MQSSPRLAAMLLLGASLFASASFAQAPADRPAASRHITPELITDFGGVMCVTLPSHRADMGFQQPTKIAEVLVHGGAEVTKGQIIIRGDDVEDQALLRLQRVRAETDIPVQRAKAGMDLAKVEYDRLEGIKEKGGSSQQEVERARLTYETARLDFENARNQQTQEVLQVDRLKARVDRLHIEAPFDGQVDNVLVDVGQAIAENEKVVRVVNVDPLWIDVGAPTEEARTHDLKQGDTAWVLLDVAGAPRLRQAKVIEAAPTADLGSRTRRVRVEFSNPKGPDRMIAGEAAWVRFTEPSAELQSRIQNAAALQAGNPAANAPSSAAAASTTAAATPATSPLPTAGKPGAPSK